MYIIFLLEIIVLSVCINAYKFKAIIIKEKSMFWIIINVFILGKKGLSAKI